MFNVISPSLSLFIGGVVAQEEELLFINWKVGGLIPAYFS